MTNGGGSVGDGDAVGEAAGRAVALGAGVAVAVAGARNVAVGAAAVGVRTGVRLGRTTVGPRVGVGVTEGAKPYSPAGRWSEVGVADDETLAVWACARPGATSVRIAQSAASAVAGEVRRNRNHMSGRE